VTLEPTPQQPEPDSYRVPVTIYAGHRPPPQWAVLWYDESVEPHQLKHWYEGAWVEVGWRPGGGGPHDVHETVAND